MHSELAMAIEVLGLVDRLPILAHNAALSKKMIEESRAFLSSQLAPENVPFDVVALGSLGRQEASGESDFDFLIIAHQLPDKVTQSRDLIFAIKELRQKLGLKEPGPTRMFGRVVSAPDLTEFIGLEDDTNRSLTHRILVLGESVWIIQNLGF